MGMHAYNKYLLSIYCIFKVLGTQKEKNETKIFLLSWGAYFIGEDKM